MICFTGCFVAFAPLHDGDSVLLRWQSNSKLVIHSVAKNPEKTIVYIGD
ncbi:MAG: hypothetical protein IJW31_05185 [Lentisphaeria bacterium]|nr:hypothetical protein [Lentisphaeria bacterium]